MDVKDLMRELADRIERTANVKAVFGDPVGEGPDAIIPVARVSVRGGGGGGSGDMPPQGESGPKGKGSGIGIGLNIVSTPVGYIKRTPRGAVFIATVDCNRAFMAAAAVAIVALVVAKSGIKLIGGR